MSLLTSLEGVLKTFLTDEEQVLLPPAAAALSNLAAAPSVANAAAQGNAFLATALAGQATVVKEELASFAATVAALSAKVAATPVAAPVLATTAAPTTATSPPTANTPH